MNARTAQRHTFPDRVDECLENAGLRGNRDRRIEDQKRVVEILMDIRPRSDDDVAHFEQNWNGTGRDVYRFSAW